MELKNNKNNDFFTFEQLDDWAKLYAQHKEIDTKKNEWLLFCIEKEYFAVQMDRIDEIALVENGIALPHTQSWVIGLINLRGDAVLLLDTGQIIGLRQSLKRSKEQRILIFKGANGRRTAFLVDSIEKVIVFDKHKLKEYSASDGGIKSRLIESIGEISGKGVSCIDVTALLAVIEEI